VFDILVYTEQILNVFDMSNFSLIRDIPFSGKKDEWLIWSEKFLDQAKRSGLKDALLAKVNIPKSGEEINENTEEGKVLMKNADINEIE
jgi:hypothetical protein